jgi:membrane peptidoglycan carboxypeptidase
MTTQNKLGLNPTESEKNFHSLNPAWLRLLLVFLIVIFPVLLFLGAGCLQAFFYLPFLPQLNSNSYVMERLNLTQWVPLNRISPLAADAVVVSEDDGFFQNNGIDWNSVKKAVKVDWKTRRLKRGGSTLTQQVVKNVYLTKRKTFSRKIAEMVLASQVPRSVTKDRVLEVYLNCAQWGYQLYGISAASQYYFKKKPSGLNAKEGAFLAMMLPNPLRYGKSFVKGELTPYAKNEIQSILDRMKLEGFLTDEQYAQETALPLAFEKKALESFQAMDLTPSPSTSPLPTP